MAKPTKPGPRAKAPVRPSKPLKPAGHKSRKAAPGAGGNALLRRLSERTGLSEAEVVSRALAAYAAAVAPDLAASAASDGGSRSAGVAAAGTPDGPQKTLGRASQRPVDRAARLFLSLDGGPEREIRPPEAVIGRDPGCDVRVDLPLIGGRHARLLLREGRWVFEDLKSPRGSYQRGAPLDVTFLSDGDEIDLGGFLPARFRVQA